MKNSLSLKEIVAIIQPIKTYNLPPEQTSRFKITKDSREIDKHSCFIAIPGESADGHQYIESAIEKGCNCIIFSNQHHVSITDDTIFLQVEDSRNAFNQLLLKVFEPYLNKVSLVAITGTNGKTTTAHLLSHIFTEVGYKCGVIGTLGAYYQKQKTTTLTNTTPDIDTILELIAQMAENDIKYVFMEVSSHAIYQRRVLNLPFDACLFTNLTQDHLDYHQSMEQYFEVKARIFLQAHPQTSTFVINSDDNYGYKLINQLRQSTNKTTTMTYGFNSKEKTENTEDTKKEIFLQISDYQEDQNGLKFNLSIKKDNIDNKDVEQYEEQLPIESSLCGKYNAFNLTMAVAYAISASIDPDIIKRAITSFSTVPGRLEKVTEPDSDICVFVDYAHTDMALDNVLSTLKSFVPGRLICLFGCGGDRDKVKRPLMAKAAIKYSDLVVITSDNPRTEEPLAIIKDIQKGIPENLLKPKIIIEPDRHRAIDIAINIAISQDTVLLAGKGHEDYQIINKEVRHFDDRLEAKKALQKRTLK